jgi:KTSC domain
MDMIYVDSSTVDQIGYDEDASEAHVIFKNGGHYIYSDVSQEAWERFRDSPSKGKFVNDEFKAKGFPCRKI